MVQKFEKDLKKSTLKFHKYFYLGALKTPGALWAQMIFQGRKLLFRRMQNAERT